MVIAEAVARPTMRFVPVKTKAQQAVLMLHKTRELFVRQRTMLMTTLRVHADEFGIVPAPGSTGTQAALRTMILAQEQLPELTQAALRAYAAQLEITRAEIERLEHRILPRHRQDATGRRLATIPGVAPITASAMVASTPDPALFRSGRQSLHGSGSHPGLIAAMARSGRRVSGKWATAIYDGSSWWARRLCSAWPADAGLGASGPKVYPITKGREPPPWR